MNNENNNSNITSTAIAVGGSIDSGKCLAPNTEVLMYTGTIKQVKDIKVGDILMGDDSTSRNVLEYHKGTGEMYKITPVKGDPYFTNGEHILCLKYTDSGYVFYSDGRKRYIVRYM